MPIGHISRPSKLNLPRCCCPLAGQWKFIVSGRGTSLIAYEGNTYVPNEKNPLPNRRRNWKCSQYYKLKCRARVTTKDGNLKVPCPDHTHEPWFFEVLDE